MEARGELRLFEALELRSEYDARIKTLERLLPEERESRGRFDFAAREEARRRPVAGFDRDAIREECRSLELRRRRLNAAIQRINLDHTVTVAGEPLTLAEALDLRKAVGERVGKLAEQLVAVAYETVIHKEERDVVDPPDADFVEVRRALEEQRGLFRGLNRALRAAAYEVSVAFRDEPA